LFFLVYSRNLPQRLIRKGDDKLRARLDKALDEIRADGTYDKIYAETFHSD